MRVLIVDDNAAIQEILSEILSVDGYETETASSLDDAADMVSSFRPDATLLDSKVGDRDGLELMDMISSRGIQPSNVLVLTANVDQVPKDNNSIAGFIQKPFKSTEVLEKVRGLFDEGTRERPRRSLFRSLFGKKGGQKETAEDHGLRFGDSYLYVEPEPCHSYAAASRFLEEDDDVLVVTSGKIKAAIERMDDGKVRVIGLSSKEGPDYVDPEMIGTLMGAVGDFIDSAERPVVLIDDLDYLIGKNDLNTILTMIHQLINRDPGKRMTLIVSTVTDNMTGKDRELLTKSMEMKVFG